LTLEPTYTAGDGNVTHVDFFSGSTLLGSDSSSPFSLSVSNILAGNQTFSARLVDSVGATGTISANAMITLPKVSVSAPVSSTSENSTSPAVVRFTIEKAQLTPLTISYNVSPSSTASSGSDFVPLSGSVIIPANSLYAEVSMYAMADGASEVTENIIIALAASGTYTVAPASSATITIVDEVPADTDGDGVADYEETARGSHPEIFDYFTIHAPPTMVARALLDSEGVSSLGIFQLSENAQDSVATVFRVHVDSTHSVFRAGGRVAEVTEAALAAARSSADHVLWLEFSAAPDGGVADREFLIPTLRAAHALAVTQTIDGMQVVTALSAGEQVSGTTVEGNAFQYARGSAASTASAAFRAIDLTTQECAEAQAVHLARTTWSVDATAYPVAPVTYYLDGSLTGQNFVLNYRFPGQPQMAAVLGASATGSSGEQVMSDGTIVELTGTSSVSGFVPLGAEFWLHREADGFPEESHHTADVNTWESYRKSLRGFFPPLPTQTVEFWLPAGFAGDAHVHQSGGDLGLTATGRTGSIPDFDAVGNAHDFNYEIFTANITQGFSFWLVVDETTLSQGVTAYYGSWVAVGGTPSNFQEVVIKLPMGVATTSGAGVVQGGASISLAPYGSGEIADYATNGDPNFFYFELFTALIDVNHAWHLVVGGMDLADGQAEYYGGWSWIGGEPAYTPDWRTITFRLATGSYANAYVSQTSGDVALSANGNDMIFDYDASGEDHSLALDVLTAVVDFNLPFSLVVDGQAQLSGLTDYYGGWSLIGGAPRDWKSVGLKISTNLTATGSLSLMQHGEPIALDADGWSLEIPDYTDSHEPHFFTYDTFAPIIDVNHAFSLTHDANAVVLTPGTQYEYWAYDGWVAFNGQPDDGVVEVQIPAERIGHTFTLRDSAGTPISSAFSFEDGVGPDHASFPLTTSWLPTQTLEVDYYTASVAGAWDPLTGPTPKMLFDETIRDSVPISVSGMNDLRRWQMPIETRPVQISTSRWGHQLTVRQWNGEEFPLCVEQTQGVIVPSDAGCWYTPYHCFSATATLRIGSDARIYDFTTDEYSPLLSTLSTGNSLIGWIALMPPQQVTAVQAGMNEVGLTWSIDDASSVAWLNEGKFALERQTDAAGPWSYVTTVAAATTPDGPWSHSNTMLLTGHQYQYRVRYHYGEPNAPERHSDWSPSNSVTLPFDASSDADGDGLLDAWEITYGTDPHRADSTEDPDQDGLDNSQERDAGTKPREADTDGDGASDGAEMANGTNPNDKDSDDDEVEDGKDAFPRDPRRSEDIPALSYAKIDVSQAVAETIGDNVAVSDVALNSHTAEDGKVTYTLAFSHEEKDANGYAIGHHSTTVRLWQVMPAGTEEEPAAPMTVLRTTSTPLPRYITSADGVIYRLDHICILNDGRPNGDGRLTGDIIIDGTGEEPGDPAVVGTFVWTPGAPPPELPDSGIPIAEIAATWGASNFLVFGEAHPQPQPPQHGAYFVNDHVYPEGSWGNEIPQQFHPTREFIPQVAGGKSLLGGYDGEFGLFELTQLEPVLTSLAAFPPLGPPPYDRMYGLAVNDGDFPALAYHNKFIDASLTAIPNYPDPGTGETTDALVLVQKRTIGKSALRGFLPEKYRQQVVPRGYVYCHVSEDGDVLFDGDVLDGPAGDSSSGYWRWALLKLERAKPPQTEPTLREVSKDETWLWVSGQGKGIDNTGILAGPNPADYLNPASGPNPTVHAGVLLPVELMVDANRDGEMSFTDAAIHSKDSTSQAKPFRFWVNNDYDKGGTVDGSDWEEDDYTQSGNPDHDRNNNVIECRRDLEDLTRLWISFKGITEMLKTGGVTLELEWKPMAGGTFGSQADGAPGIRVFRAFEPDGGRQYLDDDDTGYNQIQNPYNTGYCEPKAASPIALTLSQVSLTNLTESNPYVRLLFEGTSSGKGKLVLNLKKGGQKIGEYPPLYLELKDVKDMYERWSVGDVAAANIQENIWPGAMQPLYGPFNQAMTAPHDEAKDYILFVHGWNMSPFDKDWFSDTAFKRLWHQGYKGRFGAFRWPTFYFDRGNFGIPLPVPDHWETPERTHFDASEHRAWASAPGLLGLLGQLNSGQFNGKVRIMAHSMGNIVASEALRQASGNVAHTYVSSQAAMPAHCYDAAAPLMTYYYPNTPGLGKTTPNVYGFHWAPGVTSFPDQWQAENRPAYMHGNYMLGKATNFINYYNDRDWALDWPRWQATQQSKPDIYYNYLYTTTSRGFIYRPVDPFQNRNLTFPANRHEIFSWAAESHSWALGAQWVAGVFGTNFDLKVQLGYGSAHKFHSGQFRGTNMQRGAYWERLLIDFDLKEEAP
jgi:hypothetical protein